MFYVNCSGMRIQLISIAEFLCGKLGECVKNLKNIRYG